jgi:outer membrane protein assembly factor BamB
VIGADGTIFQTTDADLAGTATAVRAIDPTGKQLWSKVLPSTSMSDPVLSVDGTTIYFTTLGSTSIVTALSTSTGDVVWTFDTKHTPQDVSVASDGTILYAGPNGTGAIDPTGNLSRWDNTAWSYGTPSSLADDVAVFGISISPSVNARSVSDGSLKWAAKASADISVATVIGGDGTVYAIDQNGELLIMVPGNESTPIKKSITAPRKNGVSTTSPMAMGPDGTLYVLTADGHLLALGK